MSQEDALARARNLVASSSRISALTGAGISVGSGIPDFRSEGGVWERYDPLEYATHESFVNDPTKFWTMGREIAPLLLKAKPNDAHIALAQLELGGRFIGIITLNIDNLHQVAGNRNVIELRGNYLRAHCTGCSREYFGEAVHRRVAEGEIPPHCDDCGAVLKSEAVLFGEPLSQSAMSQAIQICRSTDLMLVVGASLQIYPAAYLPSLAKRNGAKVILLNLEGFNRDGVADLVLKGKASDILPKIVEY